MIDPHMPSTEVQVAVLAESLPLNTPFQLTVSNLTYEPPTNIVKWMVEVKAFVQTNLPPQVGRFIPQLVSQNSLHAELINVSFKAKAGEVTGILSTNLPERKSLSDLIINRCQFGSFDGEVVMENTRPGSSYEENCAFVHRVRNDTFYLVVCCFILVLCFYCRK
jgi:ABC-type sugar transport system ATPase subunit